MNTSGCTCNAQGPRVRLVQLRNSDSVGLVALDEIFERFHKEGRQPEPVIADELLAAVKVYNYVPPSIEGQYRVAVLREYRSYCAARS